jgi:hypothetical protein
MPKAVQLILTWPAATPWQLPDRHANLDLAFPEHHGDAKWRARATLTRTTVTGGDGYRLAGGIGPQ